MNRGHLDTSGDVRLVQFPHPGGEHAMPRDGRTSWRRGDAAHRRTFLSTAGTYRYGAAGEDQRGELAFWGEWEGAVDVVTKLDPVPGGPHWLGRPDPSVTPPDFGQDTPPQNTDPYVWGDAMRYTFCRQPTNRKLRSLGRGSVILFGSSVQSEFVLDTVFVVAGWIEHRTTSDLIGLTDDTHMRATIVPMYGWGEDKRTYRLYVGATPEDAVDGMFSFVPSRPGSGADVGFARPGLEIDGVINPNLRMQAKTLDCGEPAIRAAWDAAVDTVTTEGLALATQLTLRSAG
jgi:hypothetical protein